MILNRHLLFGHGLGVLVGLAVGGLVFSPAVEARHLQPHEIGKRVLQRFKPTFYIGAGVPHQTQHLIKDDEDSLTRAPTPSETADSARLFYALQYVNIEGTKSSLKAQPQLANSFYDPRLSGLKKNIGFTPLMLASSRGNWAAAKILIEMGAQVNAQNKLGYTALHIIAQGWQLGRATIVRPPQAGEPSPLRIGNVALPPPPPPPGQSRAPAQPEQKTSETNDVGLTRSDGSQYRLEMAHLLLKNGGDPHIQDANGNTPLHIAFMKGNTQLIQILLRAGANPLAPVNNKNKVPKDYAKFWSRDFEEREMMLWRLEHGRKSGLLPRAQYAIDFFDRLVAQALQSYANTLDHHEVGGLEVRSVQFEPRFFRSLYFQRTRKTSVLQVAKSTQLAYQVFMQRHGIQAQDNLNIHIKVPQYWWRGLDNSDFVLFLTYTVSGFRQLKAFDEAQIEGLVLLDLRDKTQPHFVHVNLHKDVGVPDSTRLRLRAPERLKQIYAWPSNGDPAKNFQLPELEKIESLSGLSDCSHILKALK